MSKRLSLAGLSVSAALALLLVAIILGDNGAPRALEQTARARFSQPRNPAVVITQMQPIAERIGETSSALAPRAFPTLPSQSQPTMPAQTPVPTAAPDSAANILYQDNFVECVNMPVGDTERFDYHCGLGEYWMIRKVTDTVGMAFAPGEYDNATFAVDGRISTFSTPAEYGILFRMSNDGKNGYGAGVYNGQYRLFRYDDGEFTELVPYTANAQIHSDDAVNHIQVVANGDQIALYVNGAQMTTLTDNTHARGGIGLYAYGTELPVEAVFDNLLVIGAGAPPSAPAQNTPGAFPTIEPTAEPNTTPTSSQEQSSDNPCKLMSGEAGLLLSNAYGIVMRFTIGGGTWGTHDYDVPGDGQLYLLRMPPGRYTYTASIQGLGSDHGEPYDYKEGYCRQIDYMP